jgi:hypothetical protein
LVKKLLIFIIGLHKKPLGCGASVASAAGPFTMKERKKERKRKKQKLKYLHLLPVIMFMLTMLVS